MTKLSQKNHKVWALSDAPDHTDNENFLFHSWQQEGDQEWDQEQAEMCEWYLDYLSCVQIYNHCHAKFYRTHEPWLQVGSFQTYCYLTKY